MMTPYENAQYIHDAIAGGTSRLSRPLLVTLLKSHLLPFLVFIAALLASGYARLYIDATFMNNSLNLLTGISTTLLAMVLTWWAWKWSEARFGGWANVRRMFGVVSSMARLETVLKLAQQEPPGDAALLETSAVEAWNAYETLARALNVPL